MEYELYKGDKLLSIGTVYQITNEMGAELEACKRELEDINRELAFDILNEPRLKRLGLRLNNIGYKLYPVSTYFKISRIGYTSPDLRKGLN